MNPTEYLLTLAEKQGAKYPVIGDISGKPCVVDTETGKVWRIELRVLEED